MKIYFFIVIILLMMKTGIVFSQNHQVTDTIPDNGVYNLLSDFLNHKLSFGFANKQKGYKFKQPRLNIIKINSPNLKTRINLRNVWGFRQNNHDWIFRQGQLFEVVNHEGIWIYQKTIVGEGGNTSFYYFSKSSESEIIWLNRKNIKEIFYDDKAFLELLSRLKWTQSIEKIIAPSGKLRVVELYLAAHKVGVHNYN